MGLRNTCADWAAGQEPADDPYIKGVKDQQYTPPAIGNRHCGPGSTQLFMMLTMLESLCADDKKKSLKHDLDSKFHGPMLAFYNTAKNYFHLLNFKGTLACSMQLFLPCFTPTNGSLTHTHTHTHTQTHTQTYNPSFHSLLHSLAVASLGAISVLASGSRPLTAVVPRVLPRAEQRKTHSGLLSGCMQVALRMCVFARKRWCPAFVSQSFVFCLMRSEGDVSEDLY